MGLSHSPKIVTDGLVLCLDAANAKSYPGSGTTWYDLSGNRTFNNGNGRIAGWRTNGSYLMPMNCALFKVYNRALTESEIKQNFNALRGRYGI